MHVMANGLVSRITQVDKIKVSDDTLEPIILRLIKLQNLSVAVNRLQTIVLMLKKISDAWKFV